MSVDFEGIDFLEHFSGLDDPRQEGNSICYRQTAATARKTPIGAKPRSRSGLGNPLRSCDLDVRSRRRDGEQDAANRSQANSQQTQLFPLD